MNLYDLVRRNDRMVCVQAGQVQATELKLATGSQRAIAMSDGSDLYLRAAHQATCLRHYPVMPNWQVRLAENARLDVRLMSESGDDTALFTTAGSPETQTVKLTWPAPTPIKFSLQLRAHGDVEICVGPLFNPRSRLLPLLHGRGVEVGPGANPAVTQGEGRQVSYIERMPMEQWAATYAKATLESAAARHWEGYVVDSAEQLSNFEDASLDFIFSSHVLEHLVNPLGVFGNWWKKLAPGGFIAGVVPDARYTFDLRQPLTTTESLLAQRAAGKFEPDDAMYERWCEHTAPTTSPASLRDREYSIHVNYFSAESFRSFLDLFALDKEVSGLFMEAVPNGKDFSFLIAKP